jgi:adenylate kinase
MQAYILVGPPGSGKGTQANLLADQFDLVHIDTSKLLEKRIMNAKEDEFIEVDGEKYSFAKEKQNWQTGILCSPPFVSGIIIEEIQKLAKEGKSVVFSGSPRTLYEAEKVLPVLEQLYGKDKIILLTIKLTPEQSINRNSHRRICELMRHPILWSEETENLTKCPLDGSNLIKREGLDDPETIKVRLKEFADRTFPIIEYLEREGIKENSINGEQPVESVFKEILRKIN